MVFILKTGSGRFWETNLIPIRSVLFAFRTHGRPPAQEFRLRLKRPAPRALCELLAARAGRAGCLLACTAATSKGSAADVRDLLVKRQATVVNRMTNRFEHEMAAGRLSPSVPARTRAQFLIDLMQGMALRASTGAAGRELRADARSYLPLLLK